MGSQYWWFYEVIVGAIALVCIFIGSKKGMMKSLFAFVGVIISAFVSFALSETIAKSICGGPLIDSNGKKLVQNISGDSFVSEYKTYLENLGYSIRVDGGKLTEIFESDEPYETEIAEYINNINGHSVDKEEVLVEKIREGFAVYVTGVVGESLNKYDTETCGILVRADSESMQEVVPLIMDSDETNDAAWYIAENYILPATKVLVRLVAYLVLFIIFAVIIIACVNSFLGRHEQSMISMSSHIGGGVFGLFTAVFIVFAVAVGVRLGAITGDNEMLFFNNDVVDKTYVFRYFYDFANKM